MFCFTPDLPVLRINEPYNHYSASPETSLSLSGRVMGFPVEVRFTTAIPEDPSRICEFGYHSSGIFNARGDQGLLQSCLKDLAKKTDIR
jgi:hypothetical protein